MRPVTLALLIGVGLGPSSVAAQELPSPLEILDTLLQIVEPPTPPARITPQRRAPYAPPTPTARPSGTEARVEPVPLQEQTPAQSTEESDIALPGDVPDAAAGLVPPVPTPHPTSQSVLALEAVVEDDVAPVVEIDPAEPIDDTPGGPIVALAPDAPCQAQLAALNTVFEPVGTVEGEGQCGISDAVRLTAIGEVDLEPAALLSCPTALRISEFTTETMTQIAQQHMGAPPEQIYVAASYSCRTRNNQDGARMSEHSFGRAIDVRAIAFAGGEIWSVQPLHESRSHARFQGALREAACGPFQTVLGPGSDGFHTDHLHFDTAERDSTYCR